MDSSSTPRSRLRNEVREKRLAFYDVHPSAKSTNNSRQSCPSSGPITKMTESTEARNGTSLNLKDLNKEDNVNVDDDCAGTSRTSEILMETARDYREIIKERQEKTKKRSRGDAVPDQPEDLCTRSVSEVLKVLGERANRRRRDLRRIEDLPDSDELEEEDAEDEENTKRESSSPAISSEVKDPPGDPEAVKGGLGFLSVLEDMEAEPGHRPDNCCPEKLAAAKYPAIPSMPACHPRISFSAQEIYSEAKRIMENSDKWSAHLNDPPQLTTAAPERSQSPTRRAVRFDCPPSSAAAASGLAVTDSSASVGASQSLDARSSASGVSCMSVGDVAKTLQELGINPKLIGIDVPSPAANRGTRRGRRKGRRLVKVCPACGKCNAENVSWCLSCATVLVGVTARPLPRRHQPVPTETSTESNGCLDDDVVEDETITEGGHSPLQSFVASSCETAVNGKGEAVVEKLFDSWEGNSVTDDDVTEPVLTPVAVETPTSVYDEEVTPLTSPMVPMSPPSPGAVWDPKKMDLVALIQQSRALVGKPVESECQSSADAESQLPGGPPVPESSLTPRHLASRSIGRPDPTLQSADTSFSSISVVTPSAVGERHPPPHLAQDLRLDLISSLDEPSDKTPTSNQPEDIAVLDRAEVLAMRQTSAASLKPDAVPQLPLSWSPGSSDRSTRETHASPADLKVDEVLYCDPNYEVQGESARSNSTCEPSPRDPNWRQSGPPRGGGHRWGGARPRPNSASAGVPQAAQNGAGYGPQRRRPASSDHHGGGYQRRWRNSSTSWSNQHPSTLKKKPAAVVVRESLDATNWREGKPPSPAGHLQEDGSVRRPPSRSHPGKGNSPRNGRSYAQQRTTSHNYYGNGSPRSPHFRPMSGWGSNTNNINSYGPEPVNMNSPREEELHRRPPSRSHPAWGDAVNMVHPPVQPKAPTPGPRINLVDVASSPINFLAFPSNENSVRSGKTSDGSVNSQIRPFAALGNPMGLMPDTVKYLEQVPDSLVTPAKRGWNVAENSPWLYLADEVWLRILRFLSIEDLTSVAASCRRLHCVANDNSLWRHIVVKRRYEMSRDQLLRIGARCPVSLKLRQCRASDVTVQDTSAFFDLCGHSLRKLSFNGCNQGAFAEDQFILLAALYCPQLTTVDVSYAYGVRDSTVRALAESCASLESVKLNGAQKITDAAIQCLIDFHADNLHTLELYCCFAVTSNSVRELGKKCANLSHVCFGTCTRVSPSALINFAGYRREKLLHLDVRGLPSVLDSTIVSIVAVCPKLESIALANCCGISNISIRALANSCPALRKLDVCGCNQVGSDGAQDLVRKCKFLEELDFSSTCVDHRTITCLARTYVPHLKTLRLNFCCNLKEDGLSRLCETTKSLRTLFLFGVRNVSSIFIQRLRLEQPRISIKSDDSVENNEQ